MTASAAPTSRRTGSASSLRPTPRLLGAALLGAAAAIAGIALTATSGWLIVRASEQPVILTLLTAIVAVRTLGIARPVLRYAERLRSHDVALDALAERRAETYARLVPLTPARLGRRRRGELLAGVVDDLTDVTEAQVRVTVPVVAAAVAGVVAAVLVALLFPPAGLVLAVLLLAVAGLTWVGWRTESRSQPDLLAARAEFTRVSALVTTRGLDLRAIGAGDAALGWLDAAHRTLATATARQSRGRAAVSAGYLMLVGAATAAVAYFAASVVGEGLSAAVKGLLVVTPFALGEVFVPLVDVVRAAARAQGSAARIDAMLDQEPAVRDPAQASLPGPGVANGRVALRGVRGSWDGVRSDVGPVDLVLEPGTRLLVTGPNGSGKSTLLALLARQLELSGGQYLVGEPPIDTRDLTLSRVRSLVAVVDDEPHVFASTVRENLRLAAPEATDHALVDALLRAGLGDWLAGLPDGLDTWLGTGARGVSGGERTRLSIARAIASGRPVLLLDEPVAHLDHATATEVLDDLLSGAGGGTVVVVSHQPIAASRFDQVLELGGPGTVCAPQAP